MSDFGSLVSPDLGGKKRVRDVEEEGDVDQEKRVL